MLGYLSASILYVQTSCSYHGSHIASEHLDSILIGVRDHGSLRTDADFVSFIVYHGKIKKTGSAILNSPSLMFPFNY